MFFCLFLFGLALVGQGEEISHFSVDINTRQDATLEVIETITVVAKGDQIKRGITRALHRQPLGNVSDLGDFKYEVVSVSRDGSPEPYFMKKTGGLPTIYIGQEDVFLDPGTYTYEVKYRAFNQVYGLDKIDEIRWPLEGKSGSLPVRDADITIRFDRDIDIIRSACYTGAYGSTAEDCEFSQDGNIVTFVATKPLQPGEGMTVAASIAAGYFQRPEPPTPLEQNTTLTLLLLGFGIALGYAYSNWRKYGVDPEGPPVKPEYFPPEGYSPATVDYLLMGWSGPRQVAASLTSLAIAGYVEIGEEERKRMFSTYDVFILRPTNKRPTADSVPPEQLALFQSLLGDGEVELGGEFQKRVEEANNAHAASLKDQHDAYLIEGNNLRKVLPLAGILGLVLLGGGVALLTTGFGALPMVIASVASLILLGVYAALIKQPSLAKVTLTNKFKGLKEYLKLSEKKRKALPNAPEMTEAYFQQVLPYAIALGIDNDWAEDLADYLAASGQQHRDGHHMVHAPYMLAGFGSRFGSSYGTSAVNPASSAGGGGGFSGGGGSVGGGGGTGGW